MARPWIKIKIEKEELSRICREASVRCNDMGSSLWKVKNTHDQILYLLTDRLELVQLKKVGEKLAVLNHWKFKNYSHSITEYGDDEFNSGGMSVYPAFYPISADIDAIALVSQWYAGYSGGGREESIADFVALESNGKYQPAMSSIPFSLSERIRACFSEKDYKTSPHCHDESGSTLSIQFKDVGKPYYQWTLNYTDFTWDAGKTEKFKKVKKHSVVLMPFGRKIQ
ncbi:hypothetical protein [Acinetobacter chinensis]|uniref:hypothetical protein n=1 Tax=Acinetobacter chinensis TaxID=2004650 RepID=UPI001D0D870E|nr:hypothetical protein [Acinetobacter chinensis]